MLQKRTDQVRAEIIKAAREGCAFSYEEGEYRNSGFSAVEGSDALDVPYGRVARTTLEFDSDGQPAGTRQSVTGLQNTLSSGGSDASDLPAWLSEQVVSLADMQARGTYAGESSLIGQPSLRYETRTEGGISSSDPTETLFIFDFVIDNPFIRSEQQYTVFPDGDVRLERQWAMSEFGVEDCGPDGEAARSTGEAVALEIKQNALNAHDALMESIEAGCTLTVTGESVFTPQTSGETQRLEGDYARNLLAYNLAIAGVVSPEDWGDENHPSEEPSEFSYAGETELFGRPAVRFEHSEEPSEFSYAGETELFGRPAVRFEHSEVRASTSGLAAYFNVLEFVRDNPLLSSATVYETLLPDGAPSITHQQGLSSISADCG